jgi:hypothetical protein
MMEMLKNLQNEDCFTLGLLHGLADSLNTCGEDCDSVNLISENKALLDKLL